MKKYLILSFLFLLATFPAIAKSANSNSTTQGQGQGQNQAVSTVTPAQNQNTTVTPTGKQIKNQNQVQTQNQGQEKKLNVQTQESQQTGQDEVEESITKVSEEVKKLLAARGNDKTGIGQQVKVIAQNQEKTQEKIKSAYYELKNRGQLVRLFVGSDKKMTQALEKMTEENKLTIQKLEELKTKTLNQAEKTQLQETIDLMLYQNTSLQEKVAKEKQTNGLFGWFTRLFSRQ